MSGQIPESPVLTDLSELLLRPKQERDLQRARRHVLDWIGCAAAGAIEPAGIALRARAVKTAPARAFVWGGLSNILEMDDVDKRARLHPGPSIVPAALAAANEQQSSMRQFLEAVICGYEATIRLGRAVGAGHYALWHSTGTCGAIGAAAASAKLYELDQQKMAQAMSLALSQAAGLWHTRHDPTSMGKQLHTAVAARAGVESAQMAQDGFTGPLAILEGDQGFFDAMCPDGSAAAILESPNRDWSIHEVSFKPWPACRHAHAAIDAALILRNHIDPSSADDICVSTYSDALKFCDNPDPQTEIEAKFSLQHSVAVSLLRGAPSMSDFSPTAIHDPDLSALRSRVRVETGNAFEARYPGRFGAAVSYGQQSAVAEDALGDPENPMSDAQIRAKADMLMASASIERSERTDIISAILEGDAEMTALVARLDEGLS